MSLIDYEKLQVIETFKKLKYGDSVYSKKFGLGTIVRFYNNEVVVDFNGYRQRFSEEEKELRELPRSWLANKKNKIEIEVNGQKTTLRELKRKRRELAKKDRVDKQIAKILAS